jgi:hypothetical protein
MAAFDRRQAVLRFDLAPGCREVGHCDQYVVEIQSNERSFSIEALGGRSGTGLRPSPASKAATAHA